MEETVVEVIADPIPVANALAATAVWVTVLFSLAQLLFVKVTKKTGIPTEYLVVVGSGLVAAAYVAFKQYVPGDIQTHAFHFTTAVFSAQWVIYESYKKFVKGK